MKALELINEMRNAGYDEAANILERRTRNGEKTELYIYDTDDESYNSGLADWLQNHTTWFNCLNRNAFKVIFK